MQILRSRVEEIMKKILVIKGSARENGATNTVIKEALKEFSVEEIKFFEPYKAEVKPCLNCGACKSKPCCVYRDLDGFFEDFKAADVIIFASPVFNGGFSSPLKAIIDRFQIFFNQFYENGRVQPIKKHRKAVLLCASGREAGEELRFMEKMLKRAFTVLNIELTGIVLAENTDEISEYSRETQKLIALLKRSLKDE